MRRWLILCLVVIAFGLSTWRVAEGQIRPLHTRVDPEREAVTAPESEMTPRRSRDRQGTVEPETSPMTRPVPATAPSPAAVQQPPPRPVSPPPRPQTQPGVRPVEAPRQPSAPPPVRTQQVPARSPQPPPAAAPLAPSRTAIETYDASGYPNPDAFNWSGFALGGHVGTRGGGVDAVVYITKWLNLRLVTDYLSFVYRTTTRNVDFDYDYELLAGTLLLDFYPGPRRQFRLSAGLVAQQKEFEITGEPKGTVSVGGRRYTPAEAGTLSGTARYDRVAPYVGIGFGNAVRPDALVGFSFDLGVTIQDYDYTLRSSGQLANNRAAMDEFQSKNEDTLDWFRIYPVITLGLTLHF